MNQLIRQEFVSDIKSIITQSRETAIRSVDFQRVVMYWHIGKTIFEEEQQGQERAEYGTYLIKNLSIELEPEFGTSFSVRQLERCRQFYKEFPIASALRSQFNWTHYKLFLPLEKDGKREFYIAEASKNNWTARQLEKKHKKKHKCRVYTFYKIEIATTPEALWQIKSWQLWETSPLRI